MRWVSELKEKVRAVIFEADTSAGKVFDVVFKHPWPFSCRRSAARDAESGPSFVTGSRNTSVSVTVPQSFRATQQPETTQL